MAAALIANTTKLVTSSAPMCVGIHAKNRIKPTAAKIVMSRLSGRMGECYAATLTSASLARTTVSP
jgi:hypothetical protein